MIIEDPEIYFGEKIKVFSTNGRVTIGELYGYDYDVDDDGNKFLEFDVENEIGLLIGFTEGEIERIEIIGGTRD